jgi:hypothetical protein
MTAGRYRQQPRLVALTAWRSAPSALSSESLRPVTGSGQQLKPRDIAAFVGFVGLCVSVPILEAPFMPAVEIGWRLGRADSGRGFATEAARAALTGDSFDWADRSSSVTVAANLASIRVTEPLGMQHDPADDFDHPRLREGDRLRHHLGHRLGRAGPLDLGSKRGDFMAKQHKQIGGGLPGPLVPGSSFVWRSKTRLHSADLDL